MNQQNSEDGNDEQADSDESPESGEISRKTDTVSVDALSGGE